MPVEVVNLEGKFARFSEQWSPKIVAQLNDYLIKLAKIEGEFVWHSHPETDELFLVLSGELTIHFRGREIRLKAGELCVVPHGVEHKPAAAQECRILLVEPAEGHRRRGAGTINTGDAPGERTAGEGVWI